MSVRDQRYYNKGKYRKFLIVGGGERVGIHEGERVGAWGGDWKRGGGDGSARVG